MFVTAIKRARKAMFPIFRVDTLSTTQTNIAVVGTGFFINSKGLFISVAHVFDGATSNTKFYYWGTLPDKIHNPMVEITEVVRDDANDLFVGNTSIKSPTFFYLYKSFPDIGRSVCVAGYPLAQLASNNQGGLELGGVRRYFQPTFVLDRVNVNMDNGQGVIRQHDGFLVRDIGLFGMSGGPVFNIEGEVVGIQGSVTPPRISTNGSRTITVENAVVIRSNKIIPFLKSKKVRVPKKRTRS